MGLVENGILTAAPPSNHENTESGALNDPSLHYIVDEQMLFEAFANAGLLGTKGSGQAGSP